MNNAIFDSCSNKFLCPGCKQELRIFDESPAYYAYCDDCFDYMYDPDDGNVIGELTEGVPDGK